METNRKNTPTWTVTEAVVNERGMLVCTTRSLTFRAENALEADGIMVGWARFIGATAVYVRNPWMHNEYATAV